MRISRVDAETIALSELNPLLHELLHRIPESADPEGNRAVEGRLYSSPTGGAEPEFDEDWIELVGPDLREHFQSAMDVVREDLEQIPRDAFDEKAVLRLAHKRLEAWVNALNQARLAIATRHNFSERDMESVPPEDHPHALPLFQMHLYGFLQEHFLREIAP